MKRILRVPRLSRRARIVRNFLLALLLLAAVVLALGGAAPHQVRGVPAVGGGVPAHPLPAGVPCRPWQLGCGLPDPGGWVDHRGQSDHAGRRRNPLFHYDGVITHVLPQDSMQVVILPLSTEEGSTVVALWGAPEEAATGELELTLEGIEPWSDILEWTVPEREVFSAQAAREGDWFFFELPPHQDHPDSEWCIMDVLWYNVSFVEGAGSWPYRLTLRDARGDVVWTGSGDTAEGNAGLWA